MDENAVAFVRSFFEAGRPVAVIRHGPWMLVEADVARGRNPTSWPSLKRPTFATREAMGRRGSRRRPRGLVASRNPDDLPAYCAKFVEEFSEGIHASQREKTAVSR